jgi:hypothetical protein
MTIINAGYILINLKFYISGIKEIIYVRQKLINLHT